MPVALGAEGRFIVSDGTVDPDSARFRGLLNSASPLMIGLAAPILAMMLIEPAALRHAQFLVVAVLLPLLFVAIGIYAYCVINPGEIKAAVADPAKRTLELVQTNGFATRRTSIPFNEITAVRLASTYDRDGYCSKQAEIELHGGERVPLATVTDEREVRALRAAVGLRLGR